MLNSTFLYVSCEPSSCTSHQSRSPAQTHGSTRGVGVLFCSRGHCDPQKGLACQLVGTGSPCSWLADVQMCRISIALPHNVALCPAMAGLQFPSLERSARKLVKKHHFLLRWEANDVHSPHSWLSTHAQSPGPTSPLPWGERQADMVDRKFPPPFM